MSKKTYRVLATHDPARVDAAAALAEGDLVDANSHEAAAREWCEMGEANGRVPGDCDLVVVDPSGVLATFGVEVEVEYKIRRSEDPSPTTVARLDRSKPPPGYELVQLDDGMWWWGETSEWLDGTSYLDQGRAIAAAWEHCEPRNDPPGMDIIRGALEAVYRAAGDLSLLTRAAAWAWYWRRVALSLAMESSGIDAYKAVWPACLAWPDRTVEHHEAAMRLLGVEVPTCA